MIKRVWVMSVLQKSDWGEATRRQAVVVVEEGRRVKVAGRRHLDIHLKAASPSRICYDKHVLGTNGPANAQ